MLNLIKLENESYLIEIKRNGRHVYYYFSGGEILTASEVRKNKIFIKCSGLDIWFDRTFRSNFLYKKWYSAKWNAQTSNPFKGKIHSEEAKSKQSISKKGRYIGTNNPFFGKTHSEETKKRISEKSGKSGFENAFFGKTHSEETRTILSIKSKKYALLNIDKMKQNGIKSAEVLAKGRKTKPEKILENILKKLNVKYKYNKIIKNIGQFDFIINDNILVEVQGDYWHANPRFYGDNKKEINERQQYKINRDKEKLSGAVKYGFSLIKFWEFDLKNNPEKIERQILCLQNMNWLR